MQPMGNKPNISMEIKKCPICGGELYQDDSRFCDYWRYECRNKQERSIECPYAIMVRASSEKEAIEKINKRAGEDELQTQIDVLKFKNDELANKVMQLEELLYH